MGEIFINEGGFPVAEGIGRCIFFDNNSERTLTGGIEFDPKLQLKVSSCVVAAHKEIEELAKNFPDLPQERLLDIILYRAIARGMLHLETYLDDYFDAIGLGSLETAMQEINNRKMR